jgi:hypothetical protein
VQSDRAEKMRSSRSSLYFTIWFSIEPNEAGVKGQICEEI